MTSVPRLRPEHRDRLTHLDASLDGVRILPPESSLPAWRLNRLNARYAPALRLAEIVLRNQSAEAGPGGLAIAAFVVNMEKLFEDLVGSALREALASYPGRTETPYRSTLDEGERVTIKPDVVQLVGDQPAVVLDARYKLASATSRYPNADLYQMIAYCTALGLTTGWLVYAHGTSSPGMRYERGSPIKVVQHHLDLDTAPQDLLRQVDRGYRQSRPARPTCPTAAPTARTRPSKSLPHHPDAGPLSRPGHPEARSRRALPPGSGRPPPRARVADRTGPRHP